MVFDLQAADNEEALRKDWAPAVSVPAEVRKMISILIAASEIRILPAPKSNGCTDISYFQFEKLKRDCLKGHLRRRDDLFSMPENEL